MQTEIKYTAQDLADRITNEMQARLTADNLGCQANLDNAVAHVKEGKKYTKVDIGGSGCYMIDSDGNIFGIKAYGVIHRGHQFGTLNTIDDWNWGRYTAFKK